MTHLNPPEDSHLSELFLRGLVHEIRNPIQGILASSEALRYRSEDSASLKLLDLIRRECIRIEQILADLLELERSPEFESSPGSVQDLVKQSVNMFHRENKSTEMEIRFQCPEKPLLMKADTRQLRKAILSILQNATESGTGRVTCDVEVVQNQDQVQITVRDNGEGILPQDLPSVTKPFFSTRARQAGLGLSIAERVIRLHQGSFRIESERGAGTTVQILLPLQR